MITKQLFLVSIRGTSSFSLLGVASLYTSWAATSEGRLEREVDVLLRVQTDDEGWNIDDLATNSENKIIDTLNETFVFID